MTSQAASLQSRLLHQQLLLLLLLTIFPRLCDAKHKILFSAVEETRNGTVIGNLRSALLQTHPFSPALLKDTTFHLSSPQPFLALNPRTSDLYVTGRLDRETLCPELNVCCDQGNCVVTAEVALIVDQSRRPEFVGGSSASTVSGGGVFRAIVFLEIAVVDINDHTPSWPQATLRVEVPEHTMPGFRIKLPLPTDPDRAPDNTTARFSLLAPAKDSGALMPTGDFSLSTEVDAAGSFTALWLQVDRELDRELEQVHRLVVTASDGGSPARTGTVSVSVIVADINDQVPQFLDLNPQVNISETAARGQVVLRLRATDADPADRGRLVFKFGSATGPEIRRLFAVERQTGQIRLIGNLDAERRQSYSFFVAVSDGRHNTETKVNVFVTDVNDNPPEVIVQSLSERNGSIWVEENKGVQMLATIMTNDRDDPKKKESIICTIDDPSFTLKELYRGTRNQFTLWSQHSFDRELLVAFNPVVTCVDGGHPRLSTVVPLQILVEDVNDNPPQFKMPSSSKIHFPENRPKSSLVLTAHAIDADSGINARLIYSIDTMSQHWFTINPFTGQLRTRSAFDRETISSFNITLTARDRGGSMYGLSTHRTLSVLIVDVNDCRPTFLQNVYEFTVTEGQRLNNVVGQVHATDDDVDFHNRLLSYEIRPVNEKDNETILAFRVASDGSILVDRESIDRETHPVYKLLVVAVDHGEPPLSGSATVSITVRDLNDNSPKWRFPVSSNNTLNVSINTVVGSELGILSAWDPDVGAHGEVEYQIASGDDSNLFDVDRKSGVIFLSRSLSKEKVKLHKLVVEAQDRGRPAMSSLSVLNIVLLNDRQAALGVAEVVLGHEVTILTVMVTGTLVIALMLLLTIFLIRFRRLGRSPNKRRVPTRNRRPERSTESRHIYSRYQLDAFSVPSSSEISSGSGNNGRRKIEEKKLRDNDSFDSGQGRSSDARSNQHGTSSTPSDISTCVRCPPTAPPGLYPSNDHTGLSRGRRRLASSNAYETCIQFPNQIRTTEINSSNSNSTTLV